MYASGFFDHIDYSLTPEEGGYQLLVKTARVAMFILEREDITIRISMQPLF